MKHKQHVIQYEIQRCGSLHAHIILWITKNDIEHFTNEIIAFVPEIFNNNKQIYRTYRCNATYFVQINNEKTTSHMWK
jgi:hypothetical protein